MIMKGQKRKLTPEDLDVSDWSSPSWESQRQFVFSVSLSKYQRGQELPEPSLRRSVLIANTLRQINLEACRPPFVDTEILQPPHSSLSPFQEKERESIFTGLTTAKYHSAGTAADSHSALGSCPLVSSNAAQLLNASLRLEDEDEDWGSMSTDSDFSLSAAISSILTALDSTTDGSSPVAPRNPLRSLENLSVTSEEGVVGVNQAIRSYASSWEPQEEYRARESSMEVTRSGYLNDVTVEDLFQDIDASVLEKDMGVYGLRGSGGGNPGADDLLWYLPPFSPSSSSSYPFALSLNQNLKCLPSFSSFSPFSSSSLSSPPPPSPFSGQNHAKEGLDLEHLMEILVES